MNQRVKPFSKWERINHFNPSGYIRKGTLQVFHKIRRLYPNDYMVCIGYDRGDTQFVLTETFKTYETSVDEVVDRCLKEECGVERIQKDKTDCYVFHEKFATIFCVPMQVSSLNLQPSPTVSEQEDPFLNHQDDKTRKLVLLLHGDLPTIQKVFGRFYSTEKEIDHLMAIPVQDIQRVFPRFFPQHFYSFSNPPPTSYLRPTNYTPVY